MDWLFAYGSLLPAGRARLPDGAVAANLLGWRRSWSVAMDNSVDLPGYKHYVTPDGERPELMVCYLDIAEQAGAVVNGVALAVGVDELPALDARERNYERCEVTGRLDVALDGRVWAYRGARAPPAPAPSAAGASGAWPSPAATASGHGRLRGPRAARRFEALTAPPGAPVAELAVVHRAPVAEPRTAARAWRGRGPAMA